MRLYLTNLWKNHKSEIGLVAGILLIYGIFFAVGITCPIKFVTGVSCPGCGMSRAYLHALKGELSAAFGYHPLWFALPIFFFWLVLFRRKQKKLAFNVTVGVFAAAMIVAYVWRMFFVQQGIVVFEPEKSIFVGIFHALKDFFNE